MKISKGILLAAAMVAMPLAMTAPGRAGAEDLKPKPGWKVSRTSWGDPDLRGKWPLDYLAGTPRIRPPQFGNRAELTDEEYQAGLDRAAQGDKAYQAEVKAGTIGMGHWTERGKPLRQTSLQTEPANGRMPTATEEGKRRAALQKSSWTEQHWDWVDDFSPFDLCITRGMPGSMLPGAYNMGIAIYQSPGYVVIQLEMVHETRIIPIGKEGGPLPAAIKGWLGYSRGHWEGDSLIIETSNFVPGAGSLGSVDGVPKAIPNSEAMTIKERLTPIDGDTIRYEAWITDPLMLNAPFKLDFPWKRNDGYELFEYACHEGDIQTRGFITATSTNPRLVAERRQKLIAQGLDPDKALPFGITLAPGTAAPEQRVNAVGERPQ
jgi:hypothetical protein